MYQYVPSGLIVYLVVTGLLRRTSHAKATRSGDALVFGPTTTVRWLGLIAIFGFACAAFYVSLTPPRSLLGAAIFGLISIAGTLAFPPNIIVTANGVSKVSWWGTKTTILWNDVSVITYHIGSATTAVSGKNGTRIVHSGWNRDTQGFLAVCKKKTGLVPQNKEL